jgi:hypothetical protein
MQVIEITSLSGQSPYNISICDLTLTYCYVVATGIVSVPPTLQLTIPSQLEGANQVLVVVTDSIGCEEFILQSCPGTPTPTPTLTSTPTPTRIVVCNCISFENTTSGSLNFSFTQCDGIVFNGSVQSGTTLYYCGKLPSAEVGVNIQINEACISNTCTSLTPTPTQTPTLTQTLPTVVGYFQDGCDPLNIFIVSNIPLSYSPLSGVYYVQSSGFIGCATSISPVVTTNVYSYILLNSQPNIGTCQILNPCPPSTPTPTPTQTQTPTNTPTQTLTNTPTQTPTNTPTLTPTNTPTLTPTQTPTLTQTLTPTQTPTLTPTPTLTQTLTPTQTPTLTPTPTLTQTLTPTQTPTLTPTPTVTCVCYTVTYSGPPPPPTPFIGVTNFSYINCSGTTVNTAVFDGFPVDVCAQQNSIVITGGDGLATWGVSLVDCCLTNPNCYYYDVTISGTDLAASTGNTFNPDNTVFVNYTDCSGGVVSSPYTVAGTYFNDICADDTQPITVSYYQDDLSYLTISSFVTQQGNCP